MTGRTIKTIRTCGAGTRALVWWVEVCKQAFADSSPVYSVLIRTHPYPSVEGGHSRFGGWCARQRRRELPITSAARALVWWVEVCKQAFVDSSPVYSVLIRTHP